MALSNQCAAVIRDLSDYLDGTVEPATRQKLEEHLSACPQCRAHLESLRNIVSLLGEEGVLTVPKGYSRRLYAKLQRHWKETGAAEVSEMPLMPLGITQDNVPFGSHLIHFWDSDEEFERGVSFLYPATARNEHCIIFGHDEALDRVKGVLRAHGHNPEQMIAERQLTVMRRCAPAAATVEELRIHVESALRAGAKAVRFLGNLGVGQSPLPAGEDDVIDLEARAGDAIAGYPCVIVCMYDVKALSGKLILGGGLRIHSLAVCSEGVRKNPYCASAHSGSSLRIQ